MILPPYISHECWLVWTGMSSLTTLLLTFILYIESSLKNYFLFVFCLGSMLESLFIICLACCNGHCYSFSIAIPPFLIFFKRLIQISVSSNTVSNVSLEDMLIAYTQAFGYLWTHFVACAHKLWLVNCLQTLRCRPSVVSCFK